MKWTHLERVLQFKVKGEIQNTVRIEKKGERKKIKRTLSTFLKPQIELAVEILVKNVSTMLLKRNAHVVLNISMRDGEKHLSKTVREMNNVGEKVEINKHGKSVRGFIWQSLENICILVSLKTAAFKKLLRQCHVLLKLQISITKNLQKDKSKWWKKNGKKVRLQNV